MDSGLSDYFRSGRRLRPVTEEFAVDNFPRMILRLKQNRLIVGLDTSAGNQTVVVLKNPQIRHESWYILQPDFDICKSIMDSVDLHLFVGDREDIIMDRILAHVRVAFAGRGVPTSA